jgi:hypothetical protein
MINNKRQRVPSMAALWMIQLLSNKRVETLIYTSRLATAPIYVGTPDHRVWAIKNGKIKKR